MKNRNEKGLKFAVVGLLLVLIILIGKDCFAQDDQNQITGTIEQKIYFTKNKISPQTEIYLKYAGKTDTGLYCWIQVSESFQQMYCGPTYSPVDWIEVSAAVGFESTDKPLKFAGSVWVGKGDFSNLFIYEKGMASESWYRNVASYKTTEQIKISLITERFIGTGPRIDLDIPKSRFFIGGEYFPATKTTIIGIGFNF